MRNLIAILSIFCLALTSFAGEINVGVESEAQIYTIQQGETVAKFAPAAGANLYSIRIAGVEYLHQPRSLAGIARVSCGTPVLYPMPNRVKDAAFNFSGQEVRFRPNSGKNFIHGLVNDYAWKVVDTQADGNSATIRCLADFGADTKLHALFPFAHQFYLTVQVRDRSVRWTYEVDNSAGSQSIPFGFALHPYFVYQGQRDQTFLTIPATHWMRSTSQMPSGELVPADQLDYPLGEPISLKATKFDDVFWGMRPEKPSVIDFRDQGRIVTIRTSQEFTHLVVWTPSQPYFGVESQTCSTDAHNLHDAGKTEAAHLQICPPKQKMTGWVEYGFTATKP